MLDEQHIKTLQSLAQRGNYSLCAKDLGVSQSAISQTIKKIESVMGVPVVFKTGKKVMLTKEALQVTQIGQEYLQKLDQTLNAFQQEHKQMRGALNIGTLSGLGKSWVAPQVIAFCSQYQEMNLQLKMDFPEELLEQFKNGDLDVLIMPESYVPATAHKRLLGDEVITLVYPDHAHYEDLDAQSEKCLLEKPYLFFQDNDPLVYNWFRNIFGATPRGIQPRLIINSFSHLLEAVSEGLGIAVMPTHVLKRYQQDKKVKTFGENSYVRTQSLYYLTHSDLAENLKVSTLYQALMKNPL